MVKTEVKVKTEIMHAYEETEVSYSVISLGLMQLLTSLIDFGTRWKASSKQV